MKISHANSSDSVGYVYESNPGLNSIAVIKNRLEKCKYYPHKQEERSKSQSGNYRPLSLTSHIAKVMDVKIRDEIVGHLQNHDLIKPSQHCFWKVQPCLTNILPR